MTKEEGNKCIGLKIKIAPYNVLLDNYATEIMLNYAEHTLTVSAIVPGVEDECLAFYCKESKAFAWRPDHYTFVDQIPEPKEEENMLAEFL